MTVKQLKEKLAGVPDDMDVMLDQYNDECVYSLAENASVEPVNFADPDIPKEEWATVDCFVITDEI